MKKTLMLLPIIATLSSVAATTGSVEAYFKNTNTHDIYLKNEKKFNKVEHKLDEVGIKTEVKVKDTGLSFGADLKGKDIVLPIETKFKLKDNVLNNSEVFLKYDLPEINKVNSYVKATLNPKVKNEGNLKLGLGVNTTIDKFTYGLDLTQELPFEEKDFANKTTLTSKLYLKSENLNASVEVKNNYGKYIYGKHKFGEAQPVDETTLHSPIEHVYLKADIKKQIKNTNLYADVDFKYHFNENEIKFIDYLTEEENVFKTYTCNGKVAIHHLYQGYRLGGVYKKDNIELDYSAFTQHLFKDEINGNNIKKQKDGKQVGDKKSNILNNRPKEEVLFGAKLSAKYVGVKNLELSANARFGLRYEKAIYYKNLDATEIEVEKNYYGYVGLKLDAKYNMNVTDKFVLTPELNTSVSFDRINFKKNYARKHHNLPTDEQRNLLILSIEPKLSAIYKPTDNLSISGNVSTKIEFSNRKYNGKKYKTVYGEIGTDLVKDFKFNSVTPKVELNVKYTW